MNANPVKTSFEVTKLTPSKKVSFYTTLIILGLASAFMMLLNRHFNDDDKRERQHSVSDSIKDVRYERLDSLFKAKYIMDSERKEARIKYLDSLTYEATKKLGK